MNTNGNSASPEYGKWCYDFMGIGNANISLDYLAILGASTFKGSFPVESAYFCGIFDVVTKPFPGISSKYSRL